MLAMVPHGGIPARLALRLVHVFPPSRVSCTWPSLVPAQMSPGLSRDWAMLITPPACSTPMLSGVSPPDTPMRLLSFRVRSGLITCQLRPPSVVWWMTWLPTYTLLWSLGEMVSGKFQTKRYLISPAGHPIGPSGQTSTFCARPVRTAHRATTPPAPHPAALDQTVLGSSGSGVAQPLSPPATEWKRLRGMVPSPVPSLLLLGPIAEGPSWRLP